MRAAESIVSMAAQSVGAFTGVRMEAGFEEETFGWLNSLYVLFEDTVEPELHAELEKRLRAVKRRRGIGDGVEVEKALYVSKTAQGVFAEVRLWIWDERFTEEDNEACTVNYNIDAQELKELTRFYVSAYERELMERFGRA